MIYIDEGNPANWMGENPKCKECREKEIENLSEYCEDCFPCYNCGDRTPCDCEETIAKEESLDEFLKTHEVFISNGRLRK